MKWAQKLDKEIKPNLERSRKSGQEEKVELAGTSATSINRVATKFGISTETLSWCINEYDEYRKSAFPRHGNALFNATYEIKKLQKQAYT